MRWPTPQCSSVLGADPTPPAKFNSIRVDEPQPPWGKHSIIPLETLTQCLSCDPGKFLFHHLGKDPQTLQERPSSWESPCTVTDPQCWLPANVSFGVSLFCPNEFGASPPSLTVGAASSWSQARNCHLGVLRSLAQFLGLLPRRKFEGVTKS